MVLKRGRLPPAGAWPFSRPGLSAGQSGVLRAHHSTRPVALSLPLRFPRSCAPQPPLLNRPGMGARLITYYRKKDGADTGHLELKKGAVRPPRGGCFAVLTTAAMAVAFIPCCGPVVWPYNLHLREACETGASPSARPCPRCSVALLACGHGAAAGR